MFQYDRRGLSFSSCLRCKVRHRAFLSRLTVSFPRYRVKYTRFCISFYGLYSKRQKEGCAIARFITGKLWPFVVMIPTVIRASRSKDTGRKATYTRHTAGYDRA